MRLKGLPLELNAYPTRSRTNAQFHGVDLTAMDRCFLPPSMACLTDVPPVGPASFIEDDNRGAISSDPVLTLDGVEFFLSVKGVGSTVDPFSFRLLDRTYAAQLTDNPDVRERLLRPSESPP
ncbi:MAG TPA: hypothetical protein VJS68_02275, partial [Thermoplasmata archaeon]|nr:hypothetical protein [Thermoplasmata archaeon]